MKKTLILTGVLAALLATGAMADGRRDRGPMGGMMGGEMGPFGGADFSQLDTNGDGQLTLEELQAQPQARFDAADTDGDGALSATELADAMKAEMSARIDARVSDMVANMDQNDDGLLQPDEMSPAGRRGGEPGDMLEHMFEHIDANEDGMISEEEFNDAMDRMQHMQRGDGPRGGGWSFFGGRGGN